MSPNYRSGQKSGALFDLADVRIELALADDAEGVTRVALLDDHIARRELDLLHGLHQHLAGARGGVGLTGWAEGTGES